MLGEDAGDMVVDHNHFVDLAVPLLSEHSDGGRATANAHPLFSCAVDDGCLARLDNHGRAFIDRKFHWLAIAQVQQRLTSQGAFFATASGEMANAAEREHLRTILAGGDVPDGLALSTYQIRLRTKVSISIDLHFSAAVAEDAFRDYADHIQPWHHEG